MKQLGFLLCVLLLFSCEKVEKSNMPYRSASFEVDLQFKDKELSGLLVQKTFVEPRNADEKMGYGGILVVHGQDAFYAYDLCCPHEAQSAIKVIPTDVGTAKCPDCGTEYDTAYGSGAPMTGPSKHALVRFNVSSTGQRIMIRY